MFVPLKSSWYQLMVTVLFAGGLVAGAILLFADGFDRNALLTFLGAVVGVAGVVLISTNQRDRDEQRDREAETHSIDEYIAASSETIAKAIKPLVEEPIDDGAAYAACDQLISNIQVLSDFIAQVESHAKYLSFTERMQVANLARNCTNTSATIKRIFNAANRHDGNPEWDDARGAVITLQNAISIVYTARRIHDRHTPSRRTRQAAGCGDRDCYGTGKA